MRRLRGFTLLELMMAIVILAVLTVVATASYIRYMRRARTQEAIAMLGDIRIRQELYYQANSRYACSGENCACTYFPTSPDPLSPVSDLPVKPAPYTPCEGASGVQAAWCQLGLDPNGDFYFTYAFVGWNGVDDAKATCGADLNTCDGPTGTDCYALDTTKPWWFAFAHANLDQDPHSVSSTFYMSSSLKQVVSFNDID
jgi:prepilin-type N-terminal cleavage/methylation domain-containing protein